MEPKLELKIGQISIGIPDGKFKNAEPSLLNILDYENGVSYSQLSELEKDVEALRRLNFPEKLRFYGFLRKRGSKLMDEGKPNTGAYYYQAARYFWNGFVAIDGGLEEFPKHNSRYNPVRHKIKVIK